MKRIFLVLTVVIYSLAGAKVASSKAIGPDIAKRSVVFVSSTTIEPEDLLHPVVHKGLGPGLVFDRKGHVLVQMSTISDPHSIECSIQSKGYWPAMLIGSDPVTGIGVLQIKAPEKVLASLSPVAQGGNKRPGFGDHIYIIGVNPDGSPSIVPGTVSAPVCPVGLRGRNIEKLIQTDIFVHRGLDGAPAFNKSGRFIGMAMRIREEPPPNVGYVLPASMVKWIAQSIIENGTVVRAYLGAKVVGVDKVLARLLDLPADKGALIVEVEPGSPASRAGLRGCSRHLRLGNRVYPMGGDLIVAVDRIPIDSDQTLDAVLNQKGPGAQILISFYRDGRLKRVKAVLGKR